MQVDPQILELERRASRAQLPMAPILRDAGVAATTWWRWRHDGVEPKLSTLRRVREALDRKIAAQDAAA